MKPGDTVRYLNAVGGGVVRRIDGKIAYVEEEGFETPVLVKDLVVVMPADYQSKTPGAKIMFDQSAFDKGRQQPPIFEKEISAPQPEDKPAPLPEVETEYGDTLNLCLAFEPRDVKHLSTTTFDMVLVNDSNYRVRYALSRRASDDRKWTLLSEDEVAPNEMYDLASFTHEDLNGIEHISLQAFVFKKEKTFTLQSVVSLEKRLNLSKFYKLHCFQPGKYFETPVIEIPVVRDGAPVQEVKVEPERLREAFATPKEAKPAKKKSEAPAEQNPHKLLPLIEVDLHIDELVDTTAGLEPSDMLSLQLDTVKKTMERHKRRIGQKIVFIHGKGEGVLRKEVLALLKKNYPKAQLQDASFKEYGFGATLVTIH